MTVSLNVSELVTETRGLLDEFNVEGITTNQILECLNRAQKQAVRIAARQVSSIFLGFSVLDSDDFTSGDDGVNQAEMPSGVFARMIKKIEVRTTGGTVVREVTPISVDHRHPYISTSSSSIPQFYDVVGTKIRCYPNLASGYELIVHYTKQPDTLVLPQGQINTINSANSYVLVDAAWTDLTTSTDSRNAFINFIDYSTGAVKGSAQIVLLDTSTKQIKIKTSALTRSTVFGRTISTSLPSSLAADDYVCVVRGTCVPQLPDGFSDFLVQHATVALKRRVKEPSEEDYAALRDIENDLKKMCHGRESTMRIRKANSILGNALRRHYL